MRIIFAALAVAAAVMASSGPASAAFFGQSRVLGPTVQRISFQTPALAPFAHTLHCAKYPDQCKVRRMAFRGGLLKLTPERRAQLAKINLDVNRSIQYEANTQGVTAERWVINPKFGDCNDYAVTKRAELLAQNWPSRALLLAEVVVPSGEHHLVLVIRTQEGDLVADNLNHNLRQWTQTRYQWVRVQSPKNPQFWSTIGATSA